jgi:hypothetical protein
MWGLNHNQRLKGSWEYLIKLKLDDEMMVFYRKNNHQRVLRQWSGFGSKGGGMG